MRSSVRQQNPFVDHPEFVECIFVAGGACANAPPYPPAPPPFPPSPPPLPSPPSKACLVLTGVIDGPLAGGLPKAAELYAHCPISDLGEYGLGRAVNGGGAGESPTLTLTSGVTVDAGAYLYVSYEVSGFVQYFGFAPNVTGGALYVNGDDAVVLYHSVASGSSWTIVDTYGDPDVDGSSTPWEYADGWGYRNSATHASAVWDATSWRVSGKDALDATDCASSHSLASCADAFPLASYTPPHEPPPLPPLGETTSSHFLAVPCDSPSGDAGWQCECCVESTCVHPLSSLCVVRRCCGVQRSPMSCCDEVGDAGALA